MKKILAITALLATSAALAETTTCNTFGVLRVDSTEKQTIVSIPWVEPSVSGGSICVSNIVKTANLSEGDELHVCENGEYKSWKIQDGIWQPATVVTTNVQGSTVTTVEGSAEKTLARGNAIMLVRQNPGSCFYLQGQVATGSATSTLAAGAWSLFAPPATSDYTLSKASWSNGETTAPNAGDSIVYKDGGTNLITVVYKNVGTADAENWQWYNRSLKESGRGVVIPVGSGAWYKNTGSAAITVTWN